MPEIELRNISKRFGKVTAAAGINLKIKSGEYVTVLGPSGCGKTTLVKILSGIWEPTEGDCFIDGKKVTGIPTYERDLGYIFQNIALFPHMTVWQNANYAPIVKDWDMEKAEKETTESLELVRALQRKGFKPFELSGGEKQKVGIARALCAGSKLLILDEPLSALDARVRLDLRYEIKRLVKRKGLTAIHVTHDQEEAMSTSDRIVLMRAGRIVEVDTPENLYNRPKNLFTANFIGEANFIEGSVANNVKSAGSEPLTCLSDESVIETRHRHRLVIKNPGGAFKVGDGVVIMVRPENLSISHREKDFSLEGRILDKIFMGSYMRYRVKLITDDTVLVEVPEADDKIFNIGDKVNVKFRPKKLLVYPQPSEGLKEVLRLE
ncbi:MAG: ABC transporter ATP-binding protein [Thermoplasmata archaeon]|nr:ABC transporter ATP-binding protein [Thermoplasmata archaeon]